MTMGTFRLSALLPSGLVLTLAFAALPGDSHAQTVDYYLGEIIVTAERLPDPPYAVSEVSQESLRRRAELRSVSEILRGLPSVHVTTGVKNEAMLYLRGFPQREVVLLLDGRPVYEPYFGTMDLSQLLLDNVVKIKIAKGPASALYGANALGGVVNIVTADAVEHTTIDATAVFGDAAYRSARLRYGGKRGRLFYWLIGSGCLADGYRLPSSFAPTATEDGGMRENSDRSTVHGYVKVGWLLPRGGKLALSAGTYSANKGVPPATRGFKPRFWRFANWDRRFVDLNAHLPARRHCLVQLRAYREHFNNTLESYTDATYSERQWVSTYHNRVTGAQALATWKARRLLELHAGLQVKHDDVKTQDNLGRPWKSFKAFTLSGSAEVNWSPAPQWQGLLRVKLDWLREESRRTLSSVNPQTGLVYPRALRKWRPWLVNKRTLYVDS